MRKITKEAVEAFASSEKFCSSNTNVQINSSYEPTMFLFNNEIARIEEYKLILSDGGVQSLTTKERLNGILDYYGLGKVKQINFEWFYIDDKGDKFNFNNGLEFSEGIRHGRYEFNNYNKEVEINVINEDTLEEIEN